MSIVNFDLESINNLENNFIKSNNIIIENVTSINKELQNISSILSTTRSSRKIPDYIEYLFSTEKELKEEDTKFENLFKVIKEKYSEYAKDVDKMVVDNNE